MDEAEECFAVVGVIEFLTKEPMEAMYKLFEGINKFYDETGILVGGLGLENFEHPFKELLEEYQKAMGRNELSLKDVMLYLSGLEKILQKKVKKPVRIYSLYMSKGRW